MNTKGLIIAVFLIDLTACTATSPSQAIHSPSSITTPGITILGLSAPNLAPEIEETNIKSSEKQYAIEEGSPTTKDVDVVQPPLISKETIDCVLTLAIEKECGGFKMRGDD